MISNISDLKKDLNPLVKDDLHIFVKLKKLFISRIDQSMENVIVDFIEKESVFYSSFGVYNIKYIEKLLEAIEKECLYFLNASIFSSFEVVYENLLKLSDGKK